jgi:hypothetical protein
MKEFHYEVNQVVVLVFPHASGFQESEWIYSGEWATIRRVYGGDPAFYDVVLKTTGRLLERLNAENFRTFPINPAWLAWNNGTVVKIAQAICEEYAFDRLPILADAVEDAGCSNNDILPHCRSNEPHVTGCWVVDLLLEKE